MFDAYDIAIEVATASVIPQIVRKTKKPNIAPIALPTTGVGNRRVRNGTMVRAMAVRMVLIIGIQPFSVTSDPNPEDTIVLSACIPALAWVFPLKV